MFDSTQLFCLIDDFFLKFEPIYWKFLKQNFRCLRIRSARLSISEIVFIAIWYKCSHFNNFKAFFTALKHIIPIYSKAYLVTKVWFIWSIHINWLYMPCIMLWWKSIKVIIYGLIQQHYLFAKISGFKDINLWYWLQRAVKVQWAGSLAVSYI